MCYFLCSFSTSCLLLHRCNVLVGFHEAQTAIKILRKQVFSDVLSRYEVDIERFLIRIVTLVMKRDPSL